VAILLLLLGHGVYGVVDDIGYHVLMDARLLHVDATETWLDEGLGKLRYGDGTAGSDSDTLARLAELSLVLDVPFGWSWSGDLHAKLDFDTDDVRVDIVEGFLKYKSAPRASLQLKGRLGAFFPPVSLENDGVAWTSPFSITPSAINSWIGEEVRTIGGEATLQRKGDESTQGILAAIFTANDPTGTLLAWRGWSLHDRKTGLFERLALPPREAFEDDGLFPMQVQWIEPFTEIDDRMGFYTGCFTELDYYGRANVLYYNNMGDPAAFDGSQYAWRTRFVSVGTELFLPADASLMMQYLQGDTRMGGPAAVDVDYWSAYLLLTKPWGRHRVSVRHDWFDVEDRDMALRQTVSLPPNNDDSTEDGTSWMAAYTFIISKHHRLIFEYLVVDSTRPERARYGQDANIEETIAQVSYRLMFD